MFDSAPDEKNLLDKLIEVSTFGLDDLELNRHGEMSGLQRSRLGLMAIVYFGICVILFTLAIGSTWLLFTQLQVVPFLPMLIWVIFVVFGGVHWLRQALPIWEDVKSGTVLCITGPLREIYTRINAGRVTAYVIHYRIAKKFFDVAFFAPKFIPQNQRCHVYYTPKSEIIIGIEPI